MKKIICTILLLSNIISIVTLTGCNREEFSDSNTNSVRNSPFKEPERSGETVIYESMQSIRSAVVDILGDKYWPDRLLTKEELYELTGMDGEFYDEFLAENMSVETDVDMMIIVHARDGKVGDVEAALNDYRNSLIDKYQKRPLTYGKIFASRIETVDKYVCFVQLGADASETQEDSEKVSQACQQENERAVDAIEKKILE